MNTPYPATAYLKGFFNEKKWPSAQRDLSLETLLRLFSKVGLQSVFKEAENKSLSDNATRIGQLQSNYIRTIDAVIRFLQNQDPTLARAIVSPDFLPQASRFDMDTDLEWSFGSMGYVDQAKYLATLYLEDLTDFVTEAVDPAFGLSRYAEQLGRSAHQFDELHQALQAPIGLIDRWYLEQLAQAISETNPILVCFTVPFPGNVFSAFRGAQYIKKNHPTIKVAMGGGFPNTELRSLQEPRVFDYFDFITLDDGERPLEVLYQQLLFQQNQQYELPVGILPDQYKRTYYREAGKVAYNNSCSLPDYKMADVGTPDYSDLPLQKYLSVIEVANPMHSLWTDGRWNKLTMAHGCYWGKCTFCDVSLDYIKLYEPVAAKLLVDRMETIITQTGTTGFHFVDEAAPPALMRELALEIIRRGLVVSWWTNIRFEKRFTADLCQLLKASGCIAVSGGLEVASDRLLALIQKGVTVAQVAQVTQHFTQSGIMVHAYLMYGYPTQTIQETIDSLEMVRQLFEAGVLQSGFWHRFALTAHSPIGLDPQAYGLQTESPDIQFAHNDVAFTDQTNVDHEAFSDGLKKSIFNYMHGIGFDYPLQYWFDFTIPKTQMPKQLIQNALQDSAILEPSSSSKLVWLGLVGKRETLIKNKKGNSWTQQVWHIFTTQQEWEVVFDADQAEWLWTYLEQAAPTSASKPIYAQVKKDFETRWDNWLLLLNSKPLQKLAEAGLVWV